MLNRKRKMKKEWAREYKNNMTKRTCAQRINKFALAQCEVEDGGEKGGQKKYSVIVVGVSRNGRHGEST
jgi:regulator of PEP synthase PpsR (kinase-PPPase family)